MDIVEFINSLITPKITEPLEFSQINGGSDTNVYMYIYN